MVGGKSVPMPKVEATPAAPQKDSPEVEEARRRAALEEQRKNRAGATVLTGQSGVTATTPTQQTRLLAR